MINQRLVSQDYFAVVAFVACICTVVCKSSEVFALEYNMFDDACLHRDLTVKIGNTLPQFGPASELVVPLGFMEVDTRLADPSVRANEEPAKLRLRLNDVMIYDKPAAGIRIFLDLRDVSERSHDTIPGYVETFSFLPRPSGTPTGELVGSFLIDLDEAVARLAASRLLPREGHKLTIIPIDDDGRPTGRVAIGSPEVLRG